MDRLRAPAREAIKRLVAVEAARLAPVGLVFEKFDEPEFVWSACCQCLLLSDPPAFAENAVWGLAVSSGLRAPDARAREALVRFLAGSNGAVVQTRLWREIAPNLVKKYARDDRVISHLLACIDVLLRNGCFVKEQFDVMRQLCWGTFASSSNVPLLCVGIDVMCAMLLVSGDENAVMQVADLLNHPYPRVRQHCCLQLHVVVSSLALWNEEVKSKIEALLIQGSSQENNVNVARQVWQLLGMQ